MKSRSRFLTVAVILLIIGSVAGGWASRMKSRAANTPSAEMKDNELVKAFTEGQRLIEENYAMERDQETITRAAVLGMLHVLDPHSSFFDRRAFNEMQEEQSSRFYGIGVTINRRNDRTCVLGVVKGMPAERAGLKYGDIIVEVDGQSAKGWSQQEVLNHVRGERGTEVKISVERVGEPVPLTFNIVRDEVPYPSVRNHFIARPGVGYIALTNGFNKKTSEELQDAIVDLKKQGMTSLVLDLRRNPGGLLKQAIEVSELFLPRSVEVVSVRGREGRVRSQVYKSENTSPESMPLVVLINQETASASEIVAGAIQDKDRGLIVGEDSFGKGLVQTVFPLPGGTGLTLTTAKYYTPSGRCIQRDYSTGSIYDYYWARRNVDHSAAPSPTPETNTVYTPTGRKLHGGGGITPDIVVKGNVENLAIRDASFEFARYLAAGVLPGLEEYKVSKFEFGYRLRGNEFPISEAVMTAFRNFLRERTELGISEALLASHADYARRRIRAELITAAYGIEAEEQYLLESDPQAVQAIEAIPKARQLTNMARLFEPTLDRH
ncbi:MAG TPA: S41 family peptidase [Blastocatellia bacterium]|nr:S41 family peptidase [Blastocatellia bacterium]